MDEQRVGETVATFIEGFAYLQGLLGPVRDETRGGVRLLAFERGRSESDFRYELFPYDLPPDVAVDVARAVSDGAPHLISALGTDAPDQIEAYRAAGYAHWGFESLMERNFRLPIPEPEVDAPPVADLAVGKRIVAAERAAGIRPHPINAVHLSNPSVFNRWVDIDGEPPAFGRLVVLDYRAYLSDVVTMPAFRKRGLAKALVLHLLRDALEAGARICVLTSSEMGFDLYDRLGFEDLIPLTGFQTPLPRPA
jgi:ribosomal protein S18 acetylase RimI-like enzyme